MKKTASATGVCWRREALAKACRNCRNIIALTLCCPLWAYATGSASTTLYVGQHFEVRDREQPTKYIFNGATRVASVTGSLSTNRRIQRLRLYTGWNLVSLAVSTADFLGQLQQNGALLANSIYQWNSAEEYSQIAAGQNLPGGAVIWVNCMTNALVGLVGNYADPVPSHLQSGGTYMAGPGLEVWAPNFTAGVDAWSYDAQANRWDALLSGDLALVSDLLLTISPGQALYLRASVAGTVDTPDPKLRVRYYHQDHLGSSSQITDAAGALVEETAFYPFGAPRHENEPRQAPDPYQFTQKERDRESGLHYFEARYLAGMQARFASVDAKYANSDNLTAQDSSVFFARPQQLNLYAYVENQPIRLTDPTGLGTWAEPWMFPDYRKSSGTIEIDWDWLGRQFMKLGNVYPAIRNRICAWPLEKCDIDWDKTRHPMSWLSISEGDQKGKPASNASSQPDGTQSGGQPGVPGEAQKRVLSVIAGIVRDIDDLVSDSDTVGKPSHRAEPENSKTPHPNPSPVVHQKQEKYMQVELHDLAISRTVDSASP